MDFRHVQNKTENLKLALDIFFLQAYNCQSVSYVALMVVVVLTE